MNYTTLQEAIADWLHRSDLKAVIPTFIKLAESRINRDLRVSEMEKLASGLVVDGKIALPDDFRQVKSLFVDDRPVTYLSELQGSAYQGLPFGYAQVENRLHIYPAGGKDYRLHYYSAIKPLSTASTNWLLSKYPEVYLYAALIESAPYIKDDARIQIWAMAYQNAITTMSQQDKVRKYGDAGLVIQGVPL